MTKPPAMFWSGETLGDRLKTLIEPFAPAPMRSIICPKNRTLRMLAKT